MLTFDSIPQVRVVRKGGRQFTPPPRPRTYAQSVWQAQVHDALAFLIGMWPLLAALLFALGLLIAGNAGTP